MNLTAPQQKALAYIEAGHQPHCGSSGIAGKYNLGSLKALHKKGLIGTTKDSNDWTVYTSLITCPTCNHQFDSNCGKYGCPNC